MKKFNVTGMSCAACSARVEKAVSGTEGVTSCAVNLLTGSMTVEGSATDSDIILAVENAGYGASLADAPQKKTETVKKEKFAPRLLSSLGFLLVLMYITMGHNMLSLPLPQLLSHNPVILAMIELLLAISVMVINQKFFINGFKGAIHGAPNMDTLVSLGSAAAFGYSTFTTFRIADAVLKNDLKLSHTLLHDLYFESAAMILVLITFGKMLESYSKGKTTSALESLIDLSPKTATVIRNGKKQIIPASEMRTGDIFEVRPGESFPADGIVTEGSTTVNEASMTGESMPCEKVEGSSVYTSTVNLSGYVVCKATATDKDTSFAKIIKMVTDASATKAPIAKTADKVSGVFVPVVLAIAFVTCFVWLLLDKPLGFAMARAISVLVISCPCALGLATPVAIMVGNGMGAKNGVLFKTAAALEHTGRIKTVVFDKTGTVTNGTPAITDIVELDSLLLPIAFSLEQKSEHPLAKAVTAYGADNNISPLPITDFEALTGKGVKAKYNSEIICGGSLSFISKLVGINQEHTDKADSFTEEGKTVLWFSKGKQLLGFIAVADTVKQQSAEAIASLHKMGINTVMLTGDNLKTAKAIAKKSGINNVLAGLLPNEKATEIERIKKNGIIAMVGDGINDAPALTAADVGIAIGAGTDVAIDAADVVLIKSSLSDVVCAIKLGRAVLTNIRENLFWAFFYNAICIPLAAGVFINLFGWKLSPMIGALAMSLSSFCVVTNALRLNFVKLKNKEIKKMEKVFKVEGMMCPHCEAHVKTALEKIAGVEKAEPSHKEGTVKVTFNAEVDDAVIKSEITAAGYKAL